MDKDSSFFDVFTISVFAIVVFCTALFLGSVLSAYVLSKLWLWYIVPFFGANPLPLIYSYGIILIVGFVCPKYYVKDERSSGEKIYYAIAIPSLFLLLGWLGTFFI